MQTQTMLVLLLCALNRISKVKARTVLKSFPSTATDGELLTMVCIKSTEDYKEVSWIRNGTEVFETGILSIFSSLSNTCDIDSRVKTSYRSGRISAHCDALQHNVTIRINATIDNGTSWCCKDTSTSNIVAINVKDNPLRTTTTRIADVSSLATTETTSIQTHKPDCDVSRDVLYFVASSVGGVVAGSIVCVVIFIIWFKTCRKRDANVYDSTCHNEDTGHLYCPVEHWTQEPNYVNTEVVGVTNDLTATAGDTPYYSSVGNNAAGRAPLFL